MKNPRQTAKKFFHSGIAETLILLFDLNDTGETLSDVASLSDLARKIFPELSGKANLSNNRAYYNFRRTLQGIPDQIAPFWGSFPDREEARWGSETDLQVIRKLRRKRQFHQIRTKVNSLYNKNHLT